MDSQSGDANATVARFCGEALFITGTYTVPFTTPDGSLPELEKNVTKNAFLYTTNTLLSVRKNRTSAVGWESDSPNFMTCNDLSQQVILIGESDDKEVFIATRNYITLRESYNVNYYGASVTSVTESSKNIYMFGNYYFNIWGLTNSSKTSTYMVQLNRDLIPSQAVPDNAIQTPFRITSSAVDPLDNVVALGLPVDKTPIVLVIDQDEKKQNFISNKYVFTGLAGADNCNKLIMEDGRIFVVCNFVEPARVNMVKYNPCTPCGPGTYSTDTDEQCLECPSGSYSSQMSLKSPQECTSCPKGTFNELQGSQNISSCIKCAPGTYSTVERASESSVCTNCPSGTASSQPGAGDPKLCEKCSIGSTSQPGSATCKNCGHRSTSFDGINCVACPFGYFMNKNDLQCVPCEAGAYCPVGSIAGNLTLSKDFNFTSVTPIPKYDDVTRKKTDVGSLKLRYDIWVKVGMVGFGVLLILVILGGWLCISCFGNPQSREKLTTTDLFFPLRHKVNDGESPVFKKTSIGGLLSILAIIIILILISNITFGYIDDNVTYQTQLEMKPWTDVSGDYSAVVDFYTFDPNPNHCNGSVNPIGFSGYMNTNFTLIDSKVCRVTWKCTVNCTTFGYRSSLDFTLIGSGASASTIDYNVTSPYLHDSEFSLISGRIFPPSTDFTYRGVEPSIVMVRGFYTLYQYLTPYYWLPSPFLKTKSTSGLALTGLSHTDGSMANSAQYGSKEEIVRVNIAFEFDASIIKIDGKQRVDFFIFLGSAASVAGTILAILGATFPIWVLFVRKADDKIIEKRRKLEMNETMTESNPLLQ
ncbi:hypothetical protein AKO1_013507 [Acrasis kona]|uniref:Tyrosine-protein kinase ephrin type A/B receptor-like domain-containing protein n=1 Tax=Acrasis kona TaxID=1008807 RepID=A0AAW2ZJD8_9EUKA